MPSPTVLNKIPATAGPIIRASVTIDELSAIALGKSRLLLTKTIINDCREGASNALITPSMILNKIMIVIL